MSSDKNSVNPYTPAIEVPENDVPPIGDTSAEPPPRSGIIRTAAVWFTICGISAVPSFFFGFALSGGKIWGMLLGVLIFAVGYTLLDFNTAEWPIRQKKRIRRTLRIVYGTRIAITILFPIASFLDVWCGMLSVLSVQYFLDPSRSGVMAENMNFSYTLITTLVQGCVMNLVLLLYAGLVAVVYLIAEMLKGQPGNHS